MFRNHFLKARKDVSRVFHLPAFAAVQREMFRDAVARRVENNKRNSHVRENPSSSKSWLGRTRSSKPKSRKPKLKRA
jgi:hypothetical protein